MQTVHTAVRTARNVVIVSVGVTEVGETMVDKDVGKGKALFIWEIVLALFCCETCTFWDHFSRCNVKPDLLFSFLLLSDIQ